MLTDQESPPKGLTAEGKDMSTGRDESSWAEEAPAPAPALGGASRPSSRRANLADKSGVTTSPPAVLRGNGDDSLAQTTISSSALRRETLVRQNAQRITVPTPQTELQHVIDRHGEHAWQVRAVKFINSPAFQHTLMGLLLLDVFILFAEIFIDAAFPHCHIIERDGVSCCPAEVAPQAGEEEHLLRWLAAEMLGSKGGDDHAHHGVCAAPYVDSGRTAGCDDHKYPAVHTTHTVLFSLTIFILGLFEIELMVLLVTLGCHLFFSHFLYVLDLVIVTASLVLELTFKLVYDSDLLAELSGLLVLLRVWRFVRIGHGLVMTTLELEAEKREKVEDRMEEMERRLREGGLEVPE